MLLCKRKTAYEMRISDWSSDVCSSDLFGERFAKRAADADPVLRRGFEEVERARRRGLQRSQQGAPQAQAHAVVLQVHGRASVSDSGCPRVVRGGAPASHTAALALAALAFHAGQIGRAHVGTPANNAPIVCRLR